MRKKKLRPFFQAASPARAILETLVVCACLTLFIVLLYGDSRRMMYSMALLFFINPSSALYYAVRVRPASGSWLRRTAAELVLMAVPSLIIFIVMASVLMRLVYEGSLSGGMGFGAEALILLAMGFPFLFFRTVVRLLMWWNRLRARRLLWSLVHNQLLAALVFQSVIVLPIMIMIVFSDWAGTDTEFLPNWPVIQFAYRIQIMLPMLGLAILGATVVLIALLPVSIIVSYFFARRIKRRLDALMDGAHAAQQGRYDRRVPVSGQDEIAQLQTDFNRMAVQLEMTVGDLWAERETVQSLLKNHRELTANVSHDLRTPVATIRAHLEAASGQGGPIAQSDLEVIEREVIRLQTLIDDLFALSRAEVEQLEMKCAPMDASAVIRRAVEAVAPLAWRVNRVEVIARTPAWLPPVVADEKRLEQVMRNLIHNSLRHTPPGGIVIVSAREDGGKAEIEVRDTGEGIQPDDLPHIWERYYRSGGGGTGLGLALVKAFTEAMRGQVSVQSVPGEGACFSIRLPLAEPASAERLPLPQVVPQTATILRQSRDNSATGV